MSEPATETLSVIVERDIPHPPEKIWRALTQPHLIAEWLMKNDFAPAVDHRFSLRGDWGSVDCRVLAVEPNKSLSYTWDALGLESIVNWTLPRVRGPICGWSRWDSGRISSRPTRAPGSAGRDSSVASNAWWRACREQNPMNASEKIDRMIADLTDWRGKTFAGIRKCILAADPEIIEEWKWMGSPLWSLDGMIAVANAHKGKVKVTFAYGAELPDPDKLFNSGFEGNARRAIDVFEGDKINERALKSLVRAAVARNRNKSKKKAPAAKRAKALESKKA